MRAAFRLALTLLVGFHAWLLWMTLAGGRALEPQTAIRWVVAAMVLVGFRALQRRGLSIFWGKRAIVLWLLVVVIHCHVAWGGEPIAVPAGIPEAVSLLAQMTAPVATVLGLFFFGLLGALMALWSAAAWHEDWPRRIAGLPASGYAFAFSPRPPPLR